MGKMNDFFKNCCNAVVDKQYYLYCAFGNIAAYIKQVDWGVVLSTALMLIGIYSDWKRKRKKKIEQEEQQGKELKQRIDLLKKQNERELQIKIDELQLKTNENKILSETVEKLFNRIDEKDKQINKLISYIQNREFEITSDKKD